MFPNNPLFVDKLIRTEQENIAREIKDVNKHPVFKPKLNMMLFILLIMLAWFFSIII